MSFPSLKDQQPPLGLKGSMMGLVNVVHRFPSLKALSGQRFSIPSTGKGLRLFQVTHIPVFCHAPCYLRNYSFVKCCSFCVLLPKEF